MKKQKKKYLFILPLILILCFFLFWLWSISKYYISPGTIDEFRQAVKDTNLIIAKKPNIIEAEDPLLFEESELNNITQFLDIIKFARFNSDAGMRCNCSGDIVFEFYDGERLLESVSFHHKQSLRWGNGWDGDMKLTSNSVTYLVDWITERTTEQQRKQIWPSDYTE
jgi:hypothetical protein